MTGGRTKPWRQALLGNVDGDLTSDGISIGEIGFGDVVGDDDDGIRALDIGCVEEAAFEQRNAHGGEVGVTDQVDANGNGRFQTGHIEFEIGAAVGRNAGHGGGDGFDGRESFR